MRHLLFVLLLASCEDNTGRAPCDDPRPAPDCVPTCSNLRDTSERICANGLWVCPPYAINRVGVCLEAGPSPNDAASLDALSDVSPDGDAGAQEDAPDSD
jgi:hypothetical protein